jgi:hypothetical protein
MNIKVVDIVLEEIVPTKEQIVELYNQLKQRTFSISHKAVPQYEDHIDFVSNHPYRAWFIIKQKKNVIGTIYVQHDNSIGLNFTNNVTEEQIAKILSMVTAQLSPLDAAPSIRFGEFFLNVSSSNIELQNKLKNIGLTESQRSFCFVKDK